MYPALFWIGMQALVRGRKVWILRIRRQQGYTRGSSPYLVNKVNHHICKEEAMQNPHSPKQSNQNQPGTLNPGDQAPAGVEGTGENVCRDCQGSGRRDDAPCPTCGGTGRVIEGIGGA
jgi:hypothetical protein